MGKKKRKANRKKPVPKPQDAGVLMQEQREAIAAMRGRRASVLGERIHGDGSLDEPLRQRAFAVGHEAYLRELLAKGHGVQAKGKADKLLHQNGWMAGLWALSLQLRLGLVAELADCVADRDWLVRLRAELVDPSDLCGIEAGGLGGQARCILDAWSLIEKGCDSEALERLKEIGRSSPLVDWRLFLQVLAKARRNAYDEAEAILPRMLAGCPARAAAERVLQTRAATMGGTYGRRIKALEQRVEKGVLKTADYPRLQALVKQALADNRPGLAMALAAAFLHSITTPQGANCCLSLFERISQRYFNLERLCIRQESAAAPREGLLQPDIMQDIRRVAWTEAELPRVWIRFFEQARRKWNEIVHDVDAWSHQEVRDNLLAPLLGDCRRLVGRLPDCREIYGFWVWAEQECNEGTEAVQAYAEAFPDDPGVVAQAVLALAARNEFDLAESWLKQLPAERAAALRQSVLYYRIKQAFMEEDAERVEQLAAGYCGEPLLERMQVRFMRWRDAARAQKRKRGLELLAFGSPWLVLYCGIACDDGFRASALPAGVKRALADDPAAVVQGYLDLLHLDERAALALDDPELYEPLCRALDSPGVPTAALRAALVALILRHRDPEAIAYESEGFIGAFKTLIDEGSADDQALATVLRIQAVYEEGYSVDFEKAERSFRVAWSLAEHDETRRMVSRVFSACAQPLGKLPKKPATQKMIDAELRMQRKFKTVEKVRERYCFRVEPVWDGGFDPFGGMEPDGLDQPYGPDSGTAPADDPWGEPECVLDPADSKPFVFSRHPLLMEFDYEMVALGIEETTRGEHRKDAAKTFKKLVGESTLSPEAKKRLMKIYKTLLEGA